MAEAEPLSKDEIMAGRSSGVSYFKLSTIAGGQAVELEITAAAKVRGVKYTVKDTDYCYRFTLATGQVMDITSKVVAGALLRMAYPEGADKFVPFRVSISRKQTHKIGETPYVLQKLA